MIRGLTPFPMVALPRLNGNIVSHGPSGAGIAGNTMRAGVLGAIALAWTVAPAFAQTDAERAAQMVVDADAAFSAGDQAGARALLEQSCALDDPFGCAGLASLLAGGLGGAEDDARARDLASSACGEGVGGSCLLLGRLLANGAGGPPDPDGAQTALAAACDLGETQACLDSAILIRAGSGGSATLQDAAQRLDRACEGGIGRACFFLAMMYDLGELGEADLDAAERAYGAACDLGEQAGCEAHARLADRPVASRSADGQAAPAQTFRPLAESPVPSGWMEPAWAQWLRQRGGVPDYFSGFNAEAYAFHLSQGNDIASTDAAFEARLTQEAGTLTDMLENQLYGLSAGEAEMIRQAVPTVLTELRNALLVGRAEFLSNPAAYTRIGRPDASDIYNPQALRAALAEYQSFQTLAQTCGTFDYSMPAMTNSALNARRAAAATYARCAEAYRDGDGLGIGDTYFDTMAAELRSFAPLRCSVRPGSGCVPDAAGRELSAIVTPENVAFMKQTKQRSYEERDLADEEVRRTNEWMDGVNAAVAAYNAAQ